MSDEHPPDLGGFRLRGDAMSEMRRKYDPEFKASDVQSVRETRRLVAEIARKLGINVSTLDNWVHKNYTERGEAEGLTTDERSELVRLRHHCTELEMENDDLKRSVILLAKKATR